MSHQVSPYKGSDKFGSSVYITCWQKKEYNLKKIVSHQGTFTCKSCWMFLPQTSKTKGHKATLGRVSSVCYLDVVSVPWAFACVHTHQVYPLNMPSSPCVNYTSAKLFYKRNIYMSLARTPISLSLGVTHL